MWAGKTLCLNSVDIWLRKMSEVASFKSAEEEGEGECRSQNTTAARIRDLTSSFSPSGRYPSVSSVICSRTRAAAAAGTSFSFPKSSNIVLLCALILLRVKRISSPSV